MDYNIFVFLLFLISDLDNHNYVVLNVFLNLISEERKIK